MAQARYIVLVEHAVPGGPGVRRGAQLATQLVDLALDRRCHDRSLARLPRWRAAGYIFSTARSARAAIVREGLRPIGFGMMAPSRT
jgi:hypothetical protein